MPLNTFSPKKPFKAKVKSVERIVGPKATGETCHIVVETNGDIPFWEGQSYGVIPPVGTVIWELITAYGDRSNRVSQSPLRNQSSAELCKG